MRIPEATPTNILTTSNAMKAFSLNFSTNRSITTTASITIKSNDKDDISTESFYSNHQLLKAL